MNRIFQSSKSKVIERSWLQWNVSFVFIILLFASGFQLKMTAMAAADEIELVGQFVQEKSEGTSAKLVEVGLDILEDTDDTDQIRLTVLDALAELAEAEEEIVPVLLDILDNGEETIKFSQSVAHALWRIGGERAQKALKEAGYSEWPMYRRDILRSSYTPYGIGDDLQVHWVRELPEPVRAWPWQEDDFEKLAFDKSYEPVAADGLLYVGSMVDDSVTAYDLETGEEIWQYIADGPVRLAPVFRDGLLYAVSDDGTLYCLDAQTGEGEWKFRAAPRKRKVLGNERMISLWPARGGPVIKDGTLYFAAGIWPHEGVYLYALDAVSGELEWVNSGFSNELIADSKEYYSFGSVAPQGHLSVQGDRLFVPGGRTPPAVFDRHEGELLYFNAITPGRTAAGGHKVFVRDDWFFNVRDKNFIDMYHVEDGAHFDGVDVDITTAVELIGRSGENIIAYRSELEGERPEPEFDRYGRPLPSDASIRGARADNIYSGHRRRGAMSGHYELKTLWESEEIDGLERLHVKAGTTIYGSGKNGEIYAIEIPDDYDETASLKWKKNIDGNIFSMITAGERLIVTTEGGVIYCLGPKDRDIQEHRKDIKPLETENDKWAARAEGILDEVDARGGYGLMFGVGSGRLLEELVRQSDLHITAYDPDPERVDELRRRFMDAGLYGRRVAVHMGDAKRYKMPPYVASLIASEDPEAGGLDSGDNAAFVEAAFHSLRPYGGVAALITDGGEGEDLMTAVEEAGLEKHELSRENDYVLLRRPGALPGSDSWTHQYGDAGNTAYSDDRRVKAPMGVAWFGGEPNHKTLPRHMFGPNPKIAGGRLVLLGPHHVSARCAYTGIELWAKKLPQVGRSFTDYEYEEGTRPLYFPSIPGANFIGSPLVITQESIYVIYEDECLHLDAASGEKRMVMEMPDREELKEHERDPVLKELQRSYGTELHEGKKLRWGNIRCYDNYLIAAAYPHMFDDGIPGHDTTYNKTSSEFIVLMDRHSGEIKWTHQANYGFRHNAIAAGNDRIFVIDNLSENILDNLGRRGIEPDISPQIRALDIESGELAWKYESQVFGTALAYSEKHDVLVQSGHRRPRGPLPDEPRDRVAAYQGADGEKLWDENHRQREAPLGMHDEWEQVLYSRGEGGASMSTGERPTHIHPMTGEELAWEWLGAIRCGTQNFSRNLITFRSGAAAFSDLKGATMTGNITGFRPGCTNNLVVADGLLNAPEYSRTCSCPYQLQTSLGLVHTPETEMWTFGPFGDPGMREVKRAGINFGAPGGRIEHSKDVMWMEYPAMVEPFPRVDVEMSNENEIDWFRHHASWFEDNTESRPWIASYGAEGETEITVELNSGGDGEEKIYDIVFHFAEPDWSVVEGERFFDVYIQDEKVLERFDVAKEAGGVLKGITRKFSAKVDEDGLSVTLGSSGGSVLPPVISGIGMETADGDDD